MRIEQLLTEAFQPEVLEVRDDSAKHHGHAGWRPGGGTHMHVSIRAAALAGLGRVEAHRRINAVLAEEFAAGLHALEIRISR